METSVSGEVEALAIAAFAFGVASLVLASISAVVWAGILEFGLRSLIQRFLVFLWLRRRFGALSTRTLASMVNMAPYVLFSLPHRQLCGQVAAALQAGTPLPEKEGPTFREAPDTGFGCMEEPAATFDSGSQRPAGLRELDYGLVEALAGSPWETDDVKLFYRAERGVDALQGHLGFYMTIFDYAACFVLVLFRP